MGSCNTAVIDTATHTRWTRWPSQPERRTG